jgi:hypothetical protein
MAAVPWNSAGLYRASLFFIAMYALRLAVLAWAIAVALSRAADPPPAELEKTVRLLLRQLESAELARRDDAEKKLIELGAPVLALLPEGQQQSAELRQRSERIRNAISRARDEAFVKQTMVTLSGSYKLSQALAEIEKQTGNRIIDYRGQFNQAVSDPALTLNFEKTPFWEALDKLLDQSALGVYPFADQQAIAIVAAAQPHVPRYGRAAYSGAFRIDASKIIAERDLRQPGVHTLELTLEVQWEPRLKPIAISQPLEEVTATDDLGQAIGVATHGAELEALVNPGTTCTELQLPLRPPGREARQIAALRGKLVALLPGGEEVFRFTNLEKSRGTEQRRGGAVVTLEQARKNNAVWEIQMLVRFDAAGAGLESYRGWIFNNPAFLQTADGKQIKPDGYETTRQTENEVGIAYLFDVAEGLAGKTFVYQTATVLMNLPLEYQLRDLPLP